MATAAAEARTPLVASAGFIKRKQRQQHSEPRLSPRMRYMIEWVLVGRTEAAMPNHVLADHLADAATSTDTQQCQSQGTTGQTQMEAALPHCSTLKQQQLTSRSRCASSSKYGESMHYIWEPQKHTSHGCSTAAPCNSSSSSSPRATAEHPRQSRVLLLPRMPAAAAQTPPGCGSAQQM